LQYSVCSAKATRQTSVASHNRGSVRPQLLVALVLSVFWLACFPASAEEQDATGSPSPAAQSSPPNSSPSPQAANSAQQPDSNAPGTAKKKDDRMFYVMPNFLTVENEEKVQPLTVKQKFATAARGSIDPYEFITVGILAGIRQAENTDPGFGQGMEGYGKRYGTAFADQFDGNIMVGGLYPSILRTDPRYFQLGKGSFTHRFFYAISRILITRTDSGKSVFNVPEFAGNATAVAISNFYYPATHHSFANNVPSWGTQMGIDALGNELKEFWPDIHRRIIHYRENHKKSQQ
jgi:hypothetical protein